MSSSIAFYIAGAIAIVTSVIHGIVGERRIIRAITFPSVPVQILSRGMLWVSIAAWAGAGVLYVAIGITGPNVLAPAIVLVEAVVLGAGIVCNCWATRGRHPGWMLLTVSIVFSLYGLANLS